MKSFDASSEIKASAGQDLGDPGRWSPLPGLGLGRRARRRPIAPGETIKVVSGANPGRTFPVKVSEFNPNKSMTWSGGMPLGLFKGVRTFTLTPAGDGTTRFQLREEYTGPLLSMMWRSMPDLGPSFAQFANGLKQRAEQPA